jgi:hypothetical protein
MESKVKESMPQVSDDTPGMMTTTNVPTEGSDWQEYVDVVLDFLAKLPDELGTFFSEYKKPLTSVGLILAASISVYITLSVLDAISHIPLLSPILELVGLGYSVWFVSRYLLKESTRSELTAEFNSLKEQVFGGKSDK